MADRLRVVLEFKKSDLEELQLYGDLMKFSNPASIVKDILKGVLSVEVISNKDDWLLENFKSIDVQWWLIWLYRKKINFKKNKFSNRNI